MSSGVRSIRRYMSSNHSIETDAMPARLPLLALACTAHRERYMPFAGDRWLWQDSGKSEA